MATPPASTSTTQQHVLLHGTVSDAGALQQLVKVLALMTDSVMISKPGSDANAFDDQLYSELHHLNSTMTIKPDPTITTKHSHTLQQAYRQLLKRSQVDAKALIGSELYCKHTIRYRHVEPQKNAVVLMKHELRAERCIDLQLTVDGAADQHANGDDNNVQHAPLVWKMTTHPLLPSQHPCIVRTQRTVSSASDNLDSLLRLYNLQPIPPTVTSVTGELVQLGWRWRLSRSIELTVTKLYGLRRANDLTSLYRLSVRSAASAAATSSIWLVELFSECDDERVSDTENRLQRIAEQLSTLVQLSKTMQVG